MRITSLQDGVFHAVLDIDGGADGGGQSIDSRSSDAIALALRVGFSPVRKPGKLPWEVESETYALEYGTDTLEVHRDAVAVDERVLVVDDVIATGGTAAATARLVGRLGAEVAGFAFLVELSFLDGRSRLGDVPVTSLVTY